MTTIAERDRPKVRDMLARELVEDVDLLLFMRGRSRTTSQTTAPSMTVPATVPAGEEGGTSEETRELLEELAGLSERLHLITHDVADAPDVATRYNVAALPTVIVRRHAGAQCDGQAGTQPAGPDEPRQALHAASDANVRFVGLPGGYEFSTLLAVIADVSKGRTDLSAAALAAVQAIDTPVQIQVFVTPSCPYCPRPARLAHQLAMENPLIVTEVIEANEFPVLSERYRVQSVPKTIINDRIEFVGSLPEAKVIEALQTAVSQSGPHQHVVGRHA